jgi:hypothetical protein
MFDFTDDVLVDDIKLENSIDKMEYNKYLYHFTKSETAINYILPTKKLLFSEMNKLDDPRDSQPMGERKIVISGNFNYIPLGVDKIKEIDQILYLPTICMSQSLSFCEDDLSKELHIYKRGYTKSRMWSHYANRHTGVCLVFAKDTLVNDIGYVYEQDLCIKYGKVNYTNSYYYDPQQIDVDLNTINKEDENGLYYEFQKAYLKSHFFNKSLDYRDECEYRILITPIMQREKTESKVRFKKNTQSINENGRYYVNIEKHLMAIIVGAKCLKNHREEIVNLINENYEVEVYALHWMRGCPSIYNIGADPVKLKRTELERIENKIKKK